MIKFWNFSLKSQRAENFATCRKSHKRCNHTCDVKEFYDVDTKDSKNPKRGDLKNSYSCIHATRDVNANGKSKHVEFNAQTGEKKIVYRKSGKIDDEKLILKRDKYGEPFKCVYYSDGSFFYWPEKAALEISTNPEAFKKLDPRAKKVILETMLNTYKSFSDIDK